MMKPILMNTEMVRAILDGRKTVTRRVVKAQHLRVLDSPYHREHPETPDEVLIERLCEPPYRPGDILYVREKWRIVDYLDGLSLKFEYEADGKISDFIDFTNDRLKKFLKYISRKGWCPGIFMPKEAARLFLRVTNVRAERLQDITPDEIWDREGIPLGRCIVPYDGFSKFWDSTIKPKDRARYGWEANPYVRVVEFEKISREGAMKDEKID